jgi:hypothetical protein
MFRSYQSFIVQMPWVTYLTSLKKTITGFIVNGEDLIINVPMQGLQNDWHYFVWWH